MKGGSIASPTPRSPRPRWCLNCWCNGRSRNGRRIMMNQAIQIAKAGAFRKLHEGSRILILPNAWDVASARLLEAAGFSAIATTSAGVNWSLGYPDGEVIGLQTM